MEETGEAIFRDVPRGVPFSARSSMLPPQAEYLSPASIRGSAALAYAPERLFLGVIDAAMEWAEDERGGRYRYAQGGHLVGVRDDRHAITIAGTRAGKGRSAIIPNMKRYRGSVLAIDPKGELALETAKVRAETLGQEVIVVDPFGTTKGALAQYERGFNPFAGMPEPGLREGEPCPLEIEGRLIEDVSLIADALVVGDQRNPHWDESARTLIEGVALDVAAAPRFAGRRNLVTVRDLIGEGEAEEGTGPVSMAGLEGWLRVSPVAMARRAAADFFDKPENEQGSVLSTARRHLRFMNFREISGSLRRDSFDLADLKRERVTLYLCLPGRHLGTCARWLRLFVNMALQAMEKTDVRPADPVLFVLDEFAALGPMRQIEDAAGQIAGYGVKLWPILQDLGQLKALYKERWETFMGNAGVLQFFGNNDLTTLEWISKRIGRTTIEIGRDSNATPDQKDAGRGLVDWQTQTVPLLEPHEAALLFGRDDALLRQLVIIGGKIPMILQRAYHDRHDAFR